MAAKEVRLHKVAPFTGAWIEIFESIPGLLAAARRSLHGSVD